MTVTNLTNTEDSHGIRIEDALVELVDVALIKCRNCGFKTSGDENLKDTEQVVLKRSLVVEKICKRMTKSLIIFNYVWVLFSITICLLYHYLIHVCVLFSITICLLLIYHD